MSAQEDLKSMSRRFAFILVERHGHRPALSFDLRSLEYEPIKSILEQYGYSVHRDPKACNTIFATRAFGNQAPIEPALIASGTDRRVNRVSLH